MIDPEAWVRIHRDERERQMQAAQRANLLHGATPGPSRRIPSRPIAGAFGRAVGHTLVRVGLWLIVAD